MRRAVVAFGSVLLLWGSSKAAVPGPRLPPPAAPDLLPPDAVQLPPRLILRVANPRPGWRYHVILARDPGFLGVVAEVTTSTGVAQFDSTPPGDLSAKITAMDENGVEGPAKLYTIMRLTPPRVTVAD